MNENTEENLGAVIKIVSVTVMIAATATFLFEIHKISPPSQEVVGRTSSVIIKEENKINNAFNTAPISSGKKETISKEKL